MAYFANGTEGAILDNQCGECPIGRDPDAPCPIILIQSLYNYKQVEKGNEKLREAMNLLVDEDGQCQMLKTIRGLKGTVPGADQVKCPKCGGLDFELHHHAGSSGFHESWMRACAACGHEFEDAFGI